MRLCIDATALLLRSAGVKNYVYHWMRSLQSEAPELEVSAFPLLGKVGDLDHEHSVLPLWQTLPRIALLHFLNITRAPLANLATLRPDVFHASNQLHNVPKGSKLTGTIYDMTVMLMPQLHTPGNVKAETGFYERILKKADGLIAISTSAKNDAVKMLGLNPDRIAVIYPGIDQRFFLPQISPATKPYILFIGTIEPRKNVDALLDAYLALPASIREEYDLAIGGPIGWAAGSTVDRLKQGMPGVKVLGYIAERDLPAVTAGASLFVYPSFYEGFGFPVVQAMAAGVPVITSNVSSLPEVVGDAGILVDPHSVDEIQQAISRVLTSTSLHTKLSGKGREQAKRFTWKNSAQRSAEFFQSLA